MKDVVFGFIILIGSILVVLILMFALWYFFPEFYANIGNSYRTVEVPNNAGIYCNVNRVCITPAPTREW